MHTKALARTARALVSSGIATLRFNFRGVGHSAGHFSGGEGELDDAARALAVLMQHTNPVGLFLGGFSFGSHVALRLGSTTATTAPLAGLLGIAPPLELFDFSFLETSRVPLLLAVGDRDPFCPVATLQAFQARLALPAVLEILPAAGHLLLERLPELEKAVQRFVHDRPRGEPPDPP
jgi:alpha/beta superfamily hydrolase